MYAFLTGKVEYVEADHMAIACGGVGYMVYASLSTLAKAPRGGEVTVYTHLAVKDDALTLYGFLSKEEKRMFERLIGISGIGPRVALNVLSKLSPGELAAAVVSADEAALKGIPNVGPRLIQRIILELKGKIDPLAFEGTLPSAPGQGNLKEAADALMTLGFTASEAMRAVAELEDSSLPVQELVRLALKNSYKG